VFAESNDETLKRVGWGSALDVAKALCGASDGANTVASCILTLNPLQCQQNVGSWWVTARRRTIS